MGFLKKVGMAWKIKDYHLVPSGITTGEGRSAVMAVPEGEGFLSKEMPLFMIGDISEQEAEQIQKDFIAGAAKGYRALISDYKGKKIRKGKLRFEKTPYEDYESTFPEAEARGLLFSKRVHKYRNVRENLGADVRKSGLKDKVKKVDWQEDYSYKVPRVKIDKYDGKPLLVYTKSGLLGETTYAIPEEAAKIWDRFSLINGKGAGEIAERFVRFNRTKGNDAELKEALNDVINTIEQYRSSGS